MLLLLLLLCMRAPSLLRCLNLSLGGWQESQARKCRRAGRRAGRRQGGRPAGCDPLSAHPSSPAACAGTTWPTCTLVGGRACDLLLGGWGVIVFSTSVPRVLAQHHPVCAAPALATAPPPACPAACPAAIPTPPPPCSHARPHCGRQRRAAAGSALRPPLPVGS